MEDVWNWLGLIAGVCLFCLGVYLLFDLIKNGFDITILLAAMFCFFLCHVVIPRRRNRSVDGWDIYDVICWVTDIPYQCIAFLLRTSWRMFGRNDGVDID